MGYPHILFEGCARDHGTLIVGLAEHLNIAIIDDLSKVTNVLNAPLEKLLSHTSALNLITIVDGLSENIELLNETLYDRSYSQVNVIGCGAGNADFEPMPCVMSNAGLKSDTAVIAATPHEFSCSTSHGWEVLTGPFLVTNSTGNTVDTLDYKPAFEVYKKEVEADSGRLFDDNNFLDIAKTYPIGIANIDGDLLVRDPIHNLNNSIQTVGSVPQNSLVYLLRGNANQLIASAEHATAGLPRDNTPSTVFTVDCIGRALVLQDRFNEEIESLMRGINVSDEMIGVTSLGEIGNTNQGPVELLNKSIIVARF